MSSWIDIPLENEEADELSRGHFAALISAALLKENKKRATVVGLTGGWGSGKSTVANFVINQIATIDNGIAVIRFEPWMVSTSEALAREFFKELGKAVLPKDDSNESKNKRVRYYKYTAQALDALSIISDAGGTLGIPAARLASKLFKGSQKALDVAAKGLEAQAHLPTLREARDTISSSLANLEKPVIVVIDDIDRLNKDEVRTVFQIIKACADFPNIRYLLLYDRKQVVHALTESVHDPNAFLEKVVGLVFDLPHSTSKQREKLLEKHLLPLGIDSLEGKALERLQEVFRSVLLPGLHTVRHVKRYVSTVSALLPGVVKDGHRSIDPADFLALEYIRQYFPNLYEVLREEESPVPGGIVFEMAYAEKLSEQRDSARKSAIPPLEPLKTLAEEALASLTDHIENYAGVRRAWGLHQHKECRFNSEYWKPVYFGFDDARANLSQQDWISLRESLSADNPDKKLFEDFDNVEIRTSVCRVIADRVDELSIAESKKLLELTLLWGEQQPSEPMEPFTLLFDPMRTTGLICAACLVRISKEENAVDALRSAYENTAALASVAYVSGMEQEEINKFGNRGEWSTSEQFKSFHKLLAPQVREYILSEAFFEHPSPDELLLSWVWLEGEEVYLRWYKSLSNDEKLLSKYINKVLATKRKQIDFSGWADDPGSNFYRAIKEIDESLLTDDGKWARQLYLSSVKRNYQD